MCIPLLVCVLIVQEPPESLVLLLSDLSDTLHSDSALLAQRTALLKHQAAQQQRPPQEGGTSAGSSGSSEPTAAESRSTTAEATGSSSAECVRDSESDGLSTELHAVEAALATAVKNLTVIYEDGLLAGELSAVGGYWLLRRFLPALQQQPQLVLRGLCALPGFRYQVRQRHAGR